MTEVSLIYKPKFTVAKGGTLQLLGRIEGWNAQPIVQADIDTITYSIFEVNKLTGREDEVTGHVDVAVVVADVIFDTLQLGDEWEDRDEIGYNFDHTPPNRTNLPFPNRGKLYEVRYKITPSNVNEQILVIAFEIEVE